MYIGVIGAGFGGLAAASLLAKKGHNVTVVEKHHMAGGRAMVWKQKGFSFDMGPSWYMMPEVFERFFKECGADVNDYYDLVRLDPSYKIFFDKADTVEVFADLHKNLELFDSLEPNGAKKLESYLIAAEYKYTVALKEFLYKYYGSIFDFFSWRFITEGLKLHVLQGLDSYVRRYFDSKKARQILEYSIVFLGCSPTNAPAMYSLITHTDLNLGIWYPMPKKSNTEVTGGLSCVADAMYRLAQHLGVKFIFDSPVRHIQVEQGRAKSLVTDKQTIPVDAVVANAEYKFVEEQLLDRKHRTYSPGYWKKKVLAPSGFIMYLGLNKKLKNPVHHTLFFDNKWERHFTDIFDNPAWPKHPSYYVCTPSVTDPKVAPKGKENLFFLVPVAAGLADTPEIREQFSQQILQHYEELIGEDIRDSIEVFRTFAHNDFSDMFHAYKGNALGLTHTLMQTAYFRPTQKSKKVKNLFFTGQWTHPGIGVPMQLISSTVIADLMHNG